MGALDLADPLGSAVYSGPFAQTCQVLGRDQLRLIPSNLRKR